METTARHTPGPWAWERREDFDAEHVVIFDPQSDCNDVLALVDHEETRHDLGQSADANARLMAAAPELLEALGNLTRQYRDMLAVGGYQGKEPLELRTADAAIAKAQSREVGVSWREKAEAETYPRGYETAERNEP